METRRTQLLATVEAAQRAAGVLAARHRGAAEDAAILIAGMDEHELAAGSLLLAELSLSLYAKASDQPVSECISTLCVELENAVQSA
jgi:Fe-Mn family superoxide dismutase